jgi:hypothetical protein
MKVSKDGAWVCFDNMTWPVPGERMDEAAHRLRYGGESRADILLAASVMHAYAQMVAGTSHKRNAVVRNIRKAQKVTP